MVERFEYRNVNAVPGLEKITVNMGVGKAVENNKRIDAAIKDLSLITGQRPVVTQAKEIDRGFQVAPRHECWCQGDIARCPNVRVLRPTD